MCLLPYAKNKLCLNCLWEEEIIVTCKFNFFYRMCFGEILKCSLWNTLSMKFGYTGAPETEMGLYKMRRTTISHNSTWQFFNFEPYYIFWPCRVSSSTSVNKKEIIWRKSCLHTWHVWVRTQSLSFKKMCEV